MESLGSNKCSPGSMSPYSPSVSQASPMHHQSSGGGASPSNSSMHNVPRITSPGQSQQHTMATPPPAHIGSYPVLSE